MADNAKKSQNIDGVRYITVPVNDALDDATIEDIVRQLAPPTVGLVGNYADVQRGGGAVLSGDAKSMAAGVEVPPGVSAEDVENTAKVNAAVEKAVEDSKTGRASSLGDAHTGASIAGGSTYNKPGSK